jgi:hypothetical protein
MFLSTENINGYFIQIFFFSKKCVQKRFLQWYSIYEKFLLVSQVLNFCKFLIISTDLKLFYQSARITIFEVT